MVTTFHGKSKVSRGRRPRTGDTLFRIVSHRFTFERIVSHFERIVSHFERIVSHFERTFHRFEPLVQIYHFVCLLVCWFVGLFVGLFVCLFVCAPAETFFR